MRPQRLRGRLTTLVVPLLATGWLLVDRLRQGEPSAAPPRPAAAVLVPIEAPCLPPLGRPGPDLPEHAERVRGQEAPVVVVAGGQHRRVPEGRAALTRCAERAPTPALRQAGYDPLQRVVHLRDQWSSGGPALVERSYAYDGAGNRTRETRHEVGPGAVDELTYDSASRLVGSKLQQGPQGLRGATYELDLSGNRERVTRRSDGADGSVAASTEVYTANALNQYTKIAPEGDPGVLREHDANGNLLAHGSWRYVYDFKDRLVKVSRQAGATLVPVAAYRYLPDGRRVRRTVYAPDGAVVLERRSLWDGPQEVEEQSEHGETVATYVWAPGYVDELLQFRRTSAHPLGAATFYVHQDARFGVVAVTDGSGQVVERRRYDDYGQVEVRDKDGNPAAGSVVGLEYGFQGRRLDPESGLYYFRARYYDPATGRFLQRDPVWDPNNAANLYTFVGNNPVTLTDPTGEIAPLLAVGIVLLGGAAVGTAVDVGVQAYTTAGFTAGDWDWRSTARSAALEAVTAPLALIGGPAARTVRGMILKRGLQELAGQAVARGVMEGLGQGSGEDEWGEEEEEEEFDNCFLAGANVETTSRGDVNIEQVRLGDRFAPPPGHEGCVDPHCGEVVRLFRNQTDRVVTITAVAKPRAREHRSAARDGGEAGEEDGEPPSSSQTIRCTPGHPFFVLGRGWVFAGDLRAGDELEARGERVVVASVEVRDEQAATFNFEVACHHTYRVSGTTGEPAVLVHNTSSAAARLLRMKAVARAGRSARVEASGAGSVLRARAAHDPVEAAALFRHGGRTFGDVNPLARAAEFRTGTRIPGPPGARGNTVQNVVEGGAHAEISAMFQSFQAGVRGGHGVLVIGPRTPCIAYCRKDIKKMGRLLGLDQLDVFDVQTMRQHVFRGSDFLPVRRGGRGWQ